MLENKFSLENDILIFMNSFFDPDKNVIKLKFYNTRNNKLYVIEDRSGFKPFTYIKADDVDPELLDKFVNNNPDKGKYEVQKITIYDGIHNKDIEVYKFMSGSVFNLYKKIHRNVGSKDQYEWNVKIHESYLLTNPP